MKLFKYFLGTVCLAVLLSGCTCHWTEQEIYAIGREYEFNNVTVKVEDDVAEERFIWYYTVNDDDTSKHSFCFEFYLSAGNTLSNSSEFEYSTSDPDEVIEFDENGYYRFYGSRIFYISYKNANEEIKNSIKNKECGLSFSFGSFEYYND